MNNSETQDRYFHDLAAYRQQVDKANRVLGKDSVNTVSRKDMCKEDCDCGDNTSSS